MGQTFILEERGGRREFIIPLKGAILCGYTGRNQDAVKRHIAELEREGIAPPPSVPTFFPKPAPGITLDEEIHVEGHQTSGEIEFVLFVDGPDLWVGLGSDHTDRELEKLDILKSKQVCPTPLSRTLWRYAEVRDQWDRIEMRCWSVKGGEKKLYQECALGTILSPEELIRRVRQKVNGPLEGIAIYSGTPPLKTEGMIFADRFEGELSDPILKRKLALRYAVHTLDWFRS